MSHFLEFVESPSLGLKTKIFHVMNNSGEILGRVSFFPQWRKYIFTQYAPGIVFDSSCLENIAGFLEHETEKWRFNASRPSDGVRPPAV